MTLRALATMATLKAARDVLDVRVRWVRLWRLVVVLLVVPGRGRWWRRARLLLLWALVACGPVGTPAPETPAEALARPAVAAALRAALAEACRATLPPVALIRCMSSLTRWPADPTLCRRRGYLSLCPCRRLRSLRCPDGCFSHD